jgi:hypothetical protein
MSSFGLFVGAVGVNLATHQTQSEVSTFVGFQQLQRAAITLGELSRDG